MTSDRKKPGVTFWATLVLVLLIAYPLSVGPTLWMDSHAMLPTWLRGAFDVFYGPLDWIEKRSDLVRNLIGWWIALWIDR